jgi:DNA-binding NarL/FixJ family response regulator
VQQRRLPRGENEDIEPLFGRRGEMTAFADALAASALGAGRILLIQGSWGLGKSRLLRAAAQLGRSMGFRVLTARGSETEHAFPFGVAIQLFEPQWKAAGSHRRRALGAGPATLAGALLTDHAHDLGGDARTHALTRSLFHLAANLTGPESGPRSEPLLVLADDVHWTDPASVGYLAYLAARITDLPITLVVAARDAEDEKGLQALDSLRAKAPSVNLRLRPFSDMEVAEVVGARFPAARSDFNTACAHWTGGHPLLLYELLKEIDNDGVGHPTVSARDLAGLVPASLVAALTARVQSMAPGARDTLQALGVLGSGASLRHTARLAGLDATTAAHAADALASAEMLSPGLPLSFSSPLMGAAVREAIRPLARARAHWHAAAILNEDRAPDAAAIHLLAAPPDDDARVVARLRSAARRDLASGGAGTADQLPVRVTQGRTDQDPAARVLAEPTEAEAPAGLPHRRDATEQTSNRHRLFASPAGVPSEDRGLALARVALERCLVGKDHASILALADEATGSAPLQRGEFAVIGAPLLTMTMVIVDELERALDLCDEIKAAAGGDDLGLGAVLGHCRAWALFETGDIDGAAAIAQRALDDLGDWPPHLRSVHEVLAHCHIQRGRLEPAGRLLDAVGTPPQGARRAFWLEARARLRLAQHRPHEAVEDAMRAGEELWSQLGASTPGVIPWRSTAALAHLALGRTDRAQALAAEELQLAERIGVTRATIRGQVVLGLAVGGTDGIELLSAAVSKGDARRPRLAYVHALVELGAALRRANKRSAAREPLRQGLDLAQRGGAKLLAQRARAELAATGARLRRTEITGPGALTPSQRRVAELAGQGLTTRRMAEALFVTPKTVEFHLRHIYKKLGVGSREELSGALTESASDLPPAAPSPATAPSDDHEPEHSARSGDRAHRHKPKD